MTFTSYSIVRYFAPHLNKSSEIVKTGLTLEEAKEHCNDPKTREAGVWFDGFTKE